MESQRYMPLEHPSSTKETRKRRLQLVAATLLGVLCAFLFLDLSRDQCCQCSSEKTTRPHQFRDSGIYANLSSAADVHWDRLMPPNGGIVMRTNDKGEQERAGVSLFHQLHCLSMIREVVQDLQADQLTSKQPRIVSHGKGNFGKPEKKKKKKTTEDHWVHCLEYMVQVVLCNADGTVEPAQESDPNDPNSGLLIEGYNVVRQCKDPDRVWHRAMGESSKPGWVVNEEGA